MRKKLLLARMERKIVYLINPIAGTKEKSSLEKAIRRATEREKLAYEIISTNASGDYNLLRERIIKEKITDIVVCGGDGTISSISGALIGIDVNIGIIPMGSGNGLALCAGISKQIHKALKVIFKGTASYIDGFYINGQFSCMLSGIGMDAVIGHDFAKQKRRGLKTYIKLSLKHFFSARTFLFEVSTSAQTFSVEAFFISIANCNQFGNNFTIAPLASLNDGLLDIIIAKKVSKLLFPFSLLQQVSGFNKRRKNILHFQTPELIIKNLSAAPLHIDGDPKETADAFEIKIVRNAIKLIQPAKP